MANPLHQSRAPGWDRAKCLLPLLKPCEAFHGLLAWKKCPLQDALGILHCLSVLVIFGGVLGTQSSDEPAPWPFIKTSGERLASSKAAAAGT